MKQSSTHAAISAEHIHESALMSAETLADYVSYQNMRGRTHSGGVLYARKVRAEERRGKIIARRRILNSLSLEQWPGALTMLTMPGHTWAFEIEMIRQRNYQGRDEKHPGERRTNFYCVERDQAIYVAAMRGMPGIRSHGFTQLSPMSIASHSVNCFYYTTAEQFITDPACPTFDAAWLDFTGYMNLARMQSIWEFWNKRCEWQLTITALNARYKRAESKLIREAGGIYEWIAKSLGGFVTDRYSYMDGHSAMIQITLQKDLRVLHG